MNKLIYFLSLLINKVPVLFLPLYYILVLFPRDEKIWVFGSSFGNSFTGNPKYLYIYANSIDDDIRPIWISRKLDIVKKLNKEGYEAYNLYSFKGIYYSLRAKKYVFDHYSKDISFWLSAGSIKLNLWHGIPFKKGHRDNKFDIVRNPRNIWDVLRWTVRRIQNEKPSHYYSVTSDINKDIWLRAFNAREDKVYTYGYPRNDIFISDKFFNEHVNIILENPESYNETVEKGKDKLKVIYMPTHRPSEKKLLEEIDFKEFDLFLKENNILFLMKLHQFSSIKSKLDMDRYENIELIDYEYDAYPYLKKSDVLVTDYSSVCFDYLLTNKPIIFFAYDIDIYRKESREIYYDYNEITPGLKAYSYDEFKCALLNLDKINDVFDGKYLKVKNQMFNDFELSSDKIYDMFKSINS